MNGVESNGADVAIVGAGASGLVAAALLRQRGINADVFDQKEAPCVLPQAHVVNTRTSEILDELGSFEALKERAAPLDKVKRIAWVESLAGRRFGALELVESPSSAALRQKCSAVHPLNVGQNHFEEVMLRRLEELGGSVRYGHRISGARIEGGRAALTIVGPDKVVHKKEYDYVLACDGANSVLRSELGIEMVGPPSLARYASAYFSADLSHLTADISGPVTFIGGADVRGPLIGFDLDRTWAFMCVMPPEATTADFNADVMRELITRALGDPSVDLELLGVGSWNMSAQVAERFREGPFFLVGDAAHRFPPTGGLGLNTGVQDAHNLAWKLAFVIEGLATPGLLDSYSAERLPVAVRNCEHSVSNVMRMTEVDEVLGVAFLAPVDPAVATQRKGELLLLDMDGDGPAAVAKREAVAAAIERQRPHFDSLNVELGFVYGGLGHDGNDYVPIVAVGARVPHAVINLPQGAVGLHALCRGHQVTLLAGAAVDLEALPRLPAGVAVHRVTPMKPEELILDIGHLDLLLIRPDGHVAWTGDENDIPGLRQALNAMLQPNSVAASQATGS